MRGIPSSFLILFFSLVFLLELISYFGIRILLKHRSKKITSYLTGFYIAISILNSGLLLFAFVNPELIRQAKNYTLFYIVISAGFINLFPKLIFSLLTIVSFILRWLIGKRAQLLLLTGSLLISSGILIMIAYGIFLIGLNNLMV